MTRAKVTWKCIVPSCYRAAPCNAQSDEADHENAKTEFLQKNSFPRRLSLSDISNPGSPLSVDDLSNSFVASNLQMFTFAELRQVTHNFSAANFLGQGGFGTVHKGFADDKLRPGRVKPQPVAVKLLDLDGLQGHKEWLTEIIFLGQLRHPHLVKLIGYCWEDEQRLLVYEYMPRGSLENQLFKRYSAALPWSTRMKIAVEAAKGLAFLHEGDKPIIFRDFKASNILLDSDYTAKLSDFGLAKDAPEGDDDSHASTRVMGTEGYAAPEYILTGHSTTMSDVYSFGVVLLELLTGKRSMHRSRQGRVHSLVEWAKPRLKDPQKLYRIMDPRLEGQFPHKGAQKVAALAHKCLCQHPKLRPSMVNVVKTLEPLPDFDDVLSGPFVYVVPSESKENVGEGGCDYVGKKKEEKHHGCWRHGMRMPRSQLVPYNLDSSLYKKFLELL